jgi:hypothetical protein
MPRRAAVGRLANAGLAQAHVDDVRIRGIRGEALCLAPVEEERDSAAVADVVQPCGCVAGRRPEPCHDGSLPPR